MLLELLSGFDPSDFVLIACLIPATWFVLSYGIGSPWYKDPLGAVILMYGLAVVALLGLIVYGIVFGQRVEEVARFIVSALLFCALTAKVVILHRERWRGRVERRRITSKGTPSDDPQ